MSASVRPDGGKPKRNLPASKDCKSLRPVDCPGAASSVKSEISNVVQHAEHEQPLEVGGLQDAELVALVAHGREDALTILVERHRSWITRVAVDILRDSGEAKDLAQNIFLILGEQASRFDPQKSEFRTWILRITRYQAIDRQRYLRARNFYRNLGLEDLVEQEEPPRIGSWLRLAKQERAYLLRELMQQLSPMPRKIVEMRFFEGMSSAQVAELTGKSVASIDNIVSRSIEKLKRIARRLGI